MLFKDHPNRNLFVTLSVVAISLMILFIFILPLLNIQSEFLKGMIVTIFLFVAAFPFIKNISSRKNKLTFEKRHGRKLK